MNFTSVTGCGDSTPSVSLTPRIRHNYCNDDLFSASNPDVNWGKLHGGWPDEVRNDRNYQRRTLGLLYGVRETDGQHVVLIVRTQEHHVLSLNNDAEYPPRKAGRRPSRLSRTTVHIPTFEPAHYNDYLRQNIQNIILVKCCCKEIPTDSTWSGPRGKLYVVRIPNPHR